MLSPAQYPDPVLLKDLRSYELQREMVLGNTNSFVRGLSINNCLLYDDRDMGKSSIAKALLHEFSSLCLIKTPKMGILHFPDLVETLTGLPTKSIVPTDGLSFSR